MKQTVVSHTTLTIADRAIEDGIIPVYLTLPERAGGADRRIKELRNISDLDVAVVVLDNDQSYPANELIGQALTFHCDDAVYGQLANRQHPIDYRTYLDRAMVPLLPSMFNYSLTCLLNDDIIDVGSFSAYVVCSNCDEVHVLDEDDFGGLQINHGEWGSPTTPFSSGRKYVSLHVSPQTYQELCIAAKRQAAISLDTPQHFEPVCVGDIVHSDFGVGRVVDILTSFDIDCNGGRVSRPGGEVVVWANGTNCIGKATRIRRGLPKEFETC